MIKLTMKIALIILLIIFSGSGNLYEVHFPTTLEKLEGTWQLENSDTFEIWKNHDSVLIGKVVKIQNHDTIIIEKLRIIRRNNEIFYEAKVLSQNEGLPVQFKLITSENNEFVFFNKKHDFPKKIIYNLQKENLIAASISGNEKTISFKYLRIE